MPISPEEVFETVKMTLHDHFDIRTVTLGINLKDCIHSDFERFRHNVHTRIMPSAKVLVREARKLEVLYGVPIINKRISVTPVSLIMETHAEQAKFLAMAETLDQAAADGGVDFLGGFGAMVQKGATRSDRVLIESLPEVLSKTKRVCSFLNVGSNVTGMNLDSIKASLLCPECGFTEVSYYSLNFFYPQRSRLGTGWSGSVGST